LQKILGQDYNHNRTAISPYLKFTIAIILPVCLFIGGTPDSSCSQDLTTREPHGTSYLISWNGKIPVARAQTFRHAEPLSSPPTLLIQDEAGEEHLHLLLFLADGQG
jgi:hypothetical protein